MLNTVKALNILLSLKKVFDSLNVTFWLDGGTLLGAYRENGFMLSDFDIDVGMLGDNDALLPDIIDGLRKEGFESFHLKEHPCGEGKQLSWVNEGTPGDIFVYYKRGDKRFRVMFDIDRLRTVRYIPCVLPKHFFEKFEKIDFMDYGVEFLMPSPTAEFLECNYGDWRIDKKPGEFRWQHDYKCMDEGFQICPKPNGKNRWKMTESLIADNCDGQFFIPLIKEGYKLYPIEIDENKKVIDGKKRLSAYKQLGVPMVETIICTNQQ